MSSRRATAAGALAIGCGGLVLALVLAVQAFPRGLLALACVALALAAAWHGLLRTGPARVGGCALALVATVLALVLLVHERFAEEVLVVGALAASVALARATFVQHVRLPSQPPPRQAVLFFNPKSGGGKAERFALAREAWARGISAVELRPGDDLERLVRAAVADGADALAMAGGDGSQAIVAAVAAEHDLPYACVPAGTRNHFALDLGVDRDDVVGSLDAFVDGGERRVDLAEVNGRVFVNNVSLGVYAEAVGQEAYRNAKLRTLLDTIPAVIGPDSAGLDLRWTGPRGHAHRAGTAVLVSNNRYRLGRAIGSGTRPHIDDGLLGITVLGRPRGRGHGHRLPQRPWREWTAATFAVDADHPVLAGIDGETVRLEPPLHFRIRPRVLRVRIARQHPGASPSASLPDGFADSVRTLAQVALHKSTTKER